MPARVAASRAEAANHGVVTDRGVGQWTFLNIVTGNRFAAQPGVTEWISKPNAKPDRQLDLLFASLAPAAHHMGRP